LSRGRVDPAHRELPAIVSAPQPRDAYNWVRKSRPEAQRFLEALNKLWGGTGYAVPGGRTPVGTRNSSPLRTGKVQERM